MRCRKSVWQLIPSLEFLLRDLLFPHTVQYDGSKRLFHLIFLLSTSSLSKEIPSKDAQATIGVLTVIVMECTQSSAPVNVLKLSRLITTTRSLTPIITTPSINFIH